MKWEYLEFSNEDSLQIITRRAAVSGGWIVQTIVVVADVIVSLLDRQSIARNKHASVSTTFVEDEQHDLVWGCLDGEKTLTEADVAALAAGRGRA